MHANSSLTSFSSNLFRCSESTFLTLIGYFWHCCYYRQHQVLKSLCSAGILYNVDLNLIVPVALATSVSWYAEHTSRILWIAMHARHLLLKQLKNDSEHFPWHQKTVVRRQVPAFTQNIIFLTERNHGANIPRSILSSSSAFPVSFHTGNISKQLRRRMYSAVEIQGCILSQWQSPAKLCRQRW